LSFETRGGEERRGEERRELLNITSSYYHFFL
jgi:hypothetical protein